MRETLFRGKGIVTDKWIFGSLVRHEAKCFIIIWEDCEHDGWVVVDPETVGQYTGLKDKNGEKIFDGDIVKNGNGGPLIIGPLEEGSFSAIGTKGKHKDTVYHISALNSNAEVIGNIYDNGELLRETDNA